LKRRGVKKDEWIQSKNLSGKIRRGETRTLSTGERDDRGEGGKTKSYVERERMVESFGTREGEGEWELGRTKAI